MRFEIVTDIRYLQKAGKGFADGCAHARTHPRYVVGGQKVTPPARRGVTTPAARLRRKTYSAADERR
jgi:hypothetical protein